MVKLTKKNAVNKSESLTIRLDPKTRFALEFTARIKEQTITTIMENAIKNVAETTYADLKHTRHNNDGQEIPTNWKYYWDINEGVRFINLAIDPCTHPTYDEEEILDFIKIHWQYFSHDKDLNHLRREYIDVLWPHMENLIDLWRETKSSNRNQARLVIEEKLKTAGLLVPSISHKEKK